MLRHFSLPVACAAGALGLLLGLSTPVCAATFQVFTSFGPFGAPGAVTTPGPTQSGSPNFNAYALNAAAALQGSYTGVGAVPTTGPFYGGPNNVPSAYGTTTGINPAINLISSPQVGANPAFNSWNAMLNPGTNFGPAFANEIGGALYFGLRLQGGPGEFFRLTDLMLTIGSADAFGNTLSALNPLATPSGYVYGTNVLGFNNGVPVPAGSPDNTIISELFYVGYGLSDTASSAGTPQQRLDAEIAFLRSLDRGQYGGFDVFGTYSLPILNAAGVPTGGTATSAPFAVTLDIPEPSSIAIWAGVVGVGGLIRAARRRRLAAAAV